MEAVSLDVKKFRRLLKKADDTRLADFLDKYGLASCVSEERQDLLGAFGHLFEFMQATTSKEVDRIGTGDLLFMVEHFEELAEILEGRDVTSASDMRSRLNSRRSLRERRCL